MLGGLGHVERMDQQLIFRRLLMAEASGRVQDRPRFGWMIGVKRAFGSRGMTVGVVLLYTAMFVEHHFFGPSFSAQR